MKVDMRELGKVQMIVLQGRLVLGETEGLRDVMRKLLEAGQERIVIDLRKVPYMDSAGIGEMAACRKRAKDKNTTLKVMRNKNQFAISVEFILDLTFPDGLFDDEREALGSF